MRLDHLALTVADRERSAAFYAEHFGFAARVHEDDHLLILADAEGSLLALSEGVVPALPRTNHFGFRLAAGAEVRDRRAAFRRAGVAEAEWQDTPDGASGTSMGTGDTMVRVQVFDPDGYRVELYAYGEG
ncbi:MAG: VOC family protein [Actinomycetota bacterium]|nr:VOC family protein [Actinomycetota bacterium]